MKPIQTLVLVADEEHARLYEKLSGTKPLQELQSLKKTDFGDTDQHYSDFPGRNAASRGGAIHAMDRTTTEREQERDAFAVHVLEAIERRLRKHDYRRVVLAAPPKMLGSLRAKMPGALAGVERVEIDKNLTSEKPQDLLARLSETIIL